MLGLQYSSTNDITKKLCFMAYAMYCRIMKAKVYQFQVPGFRFFLLCSWPLRLVP